MRDQKSMQNKRDQKGSLTVEATLVLPIFVFAILLFLSLFQLLWVQQAIQVALNRTGSYFAKNAYLYEEVDAVVQTAQTEEVSSLIQELQLDELVSSKLYQQRFERYIKEETINFGLIQGGRKGITIQSVGDYFEDTAVDLYAVYQFKIAVPFFGITSFDCLQRVQTEKWIGRAGKKRYQEKEEDKGEEEATYVYVTETGTVYHLYEDCSHLNLKVHQTTLDQIEQERNQNHGRYTKCHSCVKNVELEKGSIVYFTEEGDRYHSSRSCSGLKRTIHKILITELKEGARCCKRCEKRQGQESGGG